MLLIAFTWTFLLLQQRSVLLRRHNLQQKLNLVNPLLSHATEAVLKPWGAVVVSTAPSPAPLVDAISQQLLTVTIAESQVIIPSSAGINQTQKPRINVLPTTKQNTKDNADCRIQLAHRQAAEGQIKPQVVAPL